LWNESSMPMRVIMEMMFGRIIIIILTNCYFVVHFLRLYCAMYWSLLFYPSVHCGPIIDDFSPTQITNLTLPI
jgi:hypothetical protein